MEACLICDNKVTPQDEVDLIDKVDLHTRLTRVLETDLPAVPSVCSSCQFDLSQIEMYYKLLDIFRQRFWQTVARRGGNGSVGGGMQVKDGTPVVNLLEKTASESRRQLHDVLSSGSLLTDQITSDTGLKAETRTTLDEAKVEDPTEAAQKLLQGNNGSSSKFESSEKSAEPIHVNSHSELANDEIPSDDKSNIAHEDLVAPRRRRGRPRKNTQAPFASTSSDTNKADKKRGRPSKAQVTVREKEVKVDEGRSELDMKDEEAGLEEDPPEQEEDFSETLEDEDYKPAGAAKPTKRKKRQTVTKSKKGKIGRPKAPPLDEPISCDICYKEFTSKTRHRIHMRYHSEHRPEACNLCEKSFKTRGALNAHIKIHTAERTYTCEICNKKFLRERQLLRHQTTHSEVRPFSCEKCGKGFKTEEYMRTHNKLHHVQGRQYLCTNCGQGFFTQNALNVHMGTHKEVRDKPWKCETCGKRFGAKGTLKEHEMIHNEDDRKKFLCPVCGKAVMSANYLKYHMMKHSGDAKYLCSVCNRRFPTKGILARHTMIHTGETPYKCNVCGKGFRGYGNLAVHKMSHTDERPFKCGCGAAFRQKGKLERHWKTKKHAEYAVKVLSSSSTTTPALQVAHSESEANIAPPGIMVPVSSPPPLPVVPTMPPSVQLPPMPIEPIEIIPQTKVNPSAIDTNNAELHSGTGLQNYQIDPMYVGLYQPQPPMN